MVINVQTGDISALWLSMSEQETFLLYGYQCPNMIHFCQHEAYTDSISHVCWIVEKGGGFSSDITSEDQSSDFTFYPLVTGSARSCAISTQQ